MGAQNDLRNREEVQTLLNYVDAILPIYRRRTRELQDKLDALLRDRDHAIERLFVLDHDYQEVD